VRVGIGYDSHRFDDGRPLILGGLEHPGEPGLAGHSDGDAICHAIIDAILGAGALGDIGTLFPDTDPANEGADSIDMLVEAMRVLRTAGYRVVNVDVTVIGERPRIAPISAAIVDRLAPILGLVQRDISIKGKTNEGMGWIGRAEGLAVLAVAGIDDEPG